MPIAMFAGMVTGIIAALVALRVRERKARRRSQVTEDERLALVRAEAGNVAMSTAVHLKRYAADGESVERKDLGKLLYVAAGIPFVVVSIAGGRFDATPGLKYLLVGLAVVNFAAAGWMLVRFWRSGQRLIQH